MPLQAGSRLGAFEIIGSIGSGGMGEVYRARDTKLGREVAIKTLPAAVADDANRLARFQREAKLLASLNHAHIASVYDLDEQDGTLYIAMELVEGETLEAKLVPGALPVERALQLGLQVAEALEAAHEKGVVHRDLKPANIMVTADDVVKVLDFGLAKAVSPAPGQPVSANSPTLSMAMTQQGLILGTAGYMSPEQASGQATDQRADIWAFGVVLYEMLTGRPVFSGESVPHVLAAVLKTEPDWSRLPQDLPYRLRQTLQRCLEKKVRDRYHSIADVRVDLEKILKVPVGSDATLPMGAIPAEKRYVRLSWIAAGVAVALVSGFAGWWLRPTEPTPPMRQFSVDLGIEGIVAAGMMPAWAPDESEAAFVAEYTDGTTGLIRYLSADASVHAVPGTEGALSPFYSPGGDWIGFIRDARPWRIPTAGGEASPLESGSLQRVAAARGASWIGNMILIGGGIESFFGVPQSGGPETDFPGGLYYPDVLPGGQTALFTFREGISDFATARIDAISLTNPEEGRTTLIEQASYARYLARSGYLVFVRDGTVYAAPFDSDRPSAFDPTQAVQLRYNVAYDGGGRASLAFGSSTEIAVYRPGSGAANRSLVDLVWIDADGTITELPNMPRSDAYRWVRYSPGGDRLAVIQGIESSDSNLLIYDLERGSLRTLVSSQRIGSYIWIGDDYIFYNSTDGLHRVAVDTGETALVVESRDLPPGRNLHLAGASADRLMVSGETEDNLLDIWMASIERDPAPTIRAFEAFRSTPEFEALPAFSRDRKFVAYILSGGNVMISGYPDGQRRPVSDANIPLWSQNSDQLFVLNGTRIMVIDYAVEDGILISETPRPWGADIELVNPGTAGQVYVYSRDPNQDRFAVLLPRNDSSAASTEVRFILNISQEIERALEQLN